MERPLFFWVGVGRGGAFAFGFWLLAFGFWLLDLETLGLWDFETLRCGGERQRKERVTRRGLEREREREREEREREEGIGLSWGPGQNKEKGLLRTSATKH